MYKITKVSSDYLLAFTGFVSRKEMLQWLSELKVQLARETVASFGVIIDLRALAPLTPEAENLMNKGLELLRAGGMSRSAVILHNETAAGQLRRLVEGAEAGDWERYIPSTVPGWSDLAISWIRDGKDPDACAQQAPSELLDGYRLERMGNLTVARQN